MSFECRGAKRKQKGHKKKKPRRVVQTKTALIFYLELEFSPGFCKMMTAANQNRLRRNLRNRRNRRNRRVPANPHIEFVPKAKYQNSGLNANGVFVLTKRKRRPPTEDEIAAKKQKQLDIKIAKVSLLALRHKIVNLWQHGMHTDDFQFGPGKAKKIIAFMQATYPHYAAFNAAKSFVYRTLRREKKQHLSPEKDVHQCYRGTNKRKPKRENPEIVALTDELLTEPKATAPKVRRALRRNGHIVSLSTIYRIAKDLFFTWTKPWHTDVLTPVQKLKRKLFCARLLRMTDEAMLNLVAGYFFSDEKWWDIVGPSASRYVKARSSSEAKVQNQVCLHFFIYVFLRFLFF